MKKERISRFMLDKMRENKITDRDLAMAISVPDFVISLYLKGILYKHFTIKHDFLSNLVWHLNDILCFFKLH